MAETRRKFDQDFKEGAVRLVRETSRPTAQVIPVLVLQAQRSPGTPQGLAARRKKKRRSATRPGKGRWRAPDLVKRDFPARQLNRKWYGDGTGIRTGEGPPGVSRLDRDR